MHQKSFADLPVSPGNHFRLHFYAAVCQVLATSAERLGSADALRERFQGFDGYRNELLMCGMGSLASHQAPTWWRDAIARWEEGAADFLPVRAIHDAAGLDHDAMALVFNVGLLEEDARFGGLFEMLNDAPGQQRPTIGLLSECWGASTDRGEVRARIRRLQDLGLLHVVNPDAPRASTRPRSAGTDLGCASRRAERTPRAVGPLPAALGPLRVRPARRAGAASAGAGAASRSASRRRRTIRHRSRAAAQRPAHHPRRRRPRTGSRRARNQRPREIRR